MWAEHAGEDKGAEIADETMREDEREDVDGEGSRKPASQKSKVQSQYRSVHSKWPILSTGTKEAFGVLNRPLCDTLSMLRRRDH